MLWAEMSFRFLAYKNLLQPKNSKGSLLVKNNELVVSLDLYERLRACLYLFIM